ncbi:MAG: ATP-dependent DNA helicase RecG [Anaeroplasmataceae bacterium]|nr:ATP-dependent DNA helicase RecG [Anaeroplasmataceae bacterium]
MELAQIKSIGPKTLERLNANHVYTPKDLLLLFPKKYHFFLVDETNVFSGENVCFRAKIISKPVLIKMTKNSRAFVFYILFKNIKHKCIIFSGEYLRYKLQPNTEIICYGKYRAINKEFSLLNIFFEDFECKIDLDYGIADLSNATIHKAIERIINTNFHIEDELPIEYINKYRLKTMDEIVRIAHFPKNVQDCIQIRRRMRYEDFFWYGASLEGLRVLRKFDHKISKKFDMDLIWNYIPRLPFSLTEDQKKAVQDILNDLSSENLMNRLINGDVGSGKSIVAFIGAYATVLAGYQVCLMAPTEILAKQHFENSKFLFPNLKIEFLSSSIKEKDKQHIYEKLLSGRIDLIIGTHAVLGQRVLFKKLGLLIIDEQHRFGVNQRKILMDRYQEVDALYLTATPIPRTLGLTTFGDLDLSLIKTKPNNRKEVITKLILLDELGSLRKVLQRHIIVGEQIYVVVPLIEESETLDFIDIQQAKEIFTNLLPEASIEILHGKMKSIEKDTIMHSFKTGKINCLISTTVIEVGVDVKNATVMVILNAERYGLSQIHQLRGRVGRGNIQSYCYLVSKKDDVKRLKILEETTDGFLLAEEDFKLRGPGDYLGEAQSGFQSLAFDFESNDMAIWKCAVDDSKEFVARFLNGTIQNKKFDAIFKQLSSKKTKIN